MNILAVLLVGIFALGALAIVVGLTRSVASYARDKRTPYERAVDEHGDMKPGTFKITRGFGGGGAGSGPGGGL